MQNVDQLEQELKQNVSLSGYKNMLAAAIPPGGKERVF